MKILPTLVSSLCILPLAVSTLCAQTYEEPPILDAAIILRPEMAVGPNFRVNGPVPTYAGHNQFTIVSDFGIFEVDDNTQLVQRVGEIAAIAKLREVSKTDEYKDALKKAAESPVALAKNLAKDPVKTISGVPKGLWKFMNRAGQSVKEAGEQRERSPFEDDATKNLIGFSKAKRDLALRLGVDPYSSNETLQKELNGISWASFGGKMTMTLALAPVGGGAGVVITSINVSDTATQALRDLSPSDLRLQHLQKLLDLQVSREDAVAFLNNPAYSPTQATLLVAAFEQLRGVENLVGFVRLTTDATEEIDALFFRRTAQVLAQVHRETPLASLREFRGFPVAIARDGSLVVGLEWDYACWTQNAANFVQELTNGNTYPGYRFVLTGVASSKCKDELTARKIVLTERALPGPLQ